MKKPGKTYENKAHDGPFNASYEYLMVCPICRLEKIVFGDTSDIINNLLDDKSETKIEDESVDLCEKIVEKDNEEDDEKDDKDSKDSEDESDQDVSILNHNDSRKLEKKKVAWIDEDDNNYT